jgi:DNA-binding CsgD family transcriptional regulator
MHDDRMHLHGRMPFTLSPRSSQVAGALRGSLSLKEIAVHFQISDATVRTHMLRIGIKMGDYGRPLSTRAEICSFLNKAPFDGMLHPPHCACNEDHGAMGRLPELERPQPELMASTSYNERRRPSNGARQLTGS